MKKILFVSHDASRTGAPVALLHLIRFLKSNINVDVTILLKKDGPLKSDFQALGKVIVSPQVYFTNSIFKRGLNFLFRNYDLRSKRLIAVLIRQNFDLIYGNTAASCDVVLALLKKKKILAILHIHELPIMIQLFCGERHFSNAIQVVDKIFAVSKLVEKMLLEKYLLNAEKICRVYEPVPAYENKEKSKTRDIKADFTVIGCGTIDWRKAPDLFVQVAKRVNIKSPENNIKFLWIGGNLKGNDFLLLEHDLSLSGLCEKVCFIGETSDVKKLFMRGDAFLLTSREDPFPLVCLENANAGNPIICFKQTTGISEIINNSNGFVADFLDLEAISDEILRLASEPSYYQTKSENIKKLANDFVPEVVCKSMMEEIQKLLTRA